MRDPVAEAQGRVMNAVLHRLEIPLPEWLLRYAESADDLPDVAARMDFVVGAARLSTQKGGGPFAAAVFGAHGGLVALGVNLVTGLRLSILHAEVVALTVAQARLRSFDLGAGHAACELVSSAEPCAMCLGAVHWSGVKRLVVGARGPDVETNGFDEGPKPSDWSGELERRGIEVVRDVRRAEAVRVIADYVRGGGPIYGPHSRNK